MKFIIIKDFKDVTDEVKTEQTIFEQLSNLYLKLDAIYLVLPLADLINKKGIDYVQNIVNHALSQKPRNPFFVCQHYQVNRINFGKAMVFTSNAMIGSDKFAIPNYSNYTAQNTLKPFRNRKYLMSFRGSLMTYPSRQRLFQVLSARKDCKILDSGGWHFFKSVEDKKKAVNEYRKLMHDTKIALCPRGAGVSTIRLWEAMSYACVPLLISDKLKMPLEHKVEWKGCLIRVPENDISNLMDYLPEEDKLEEMSKKVLEVYKRYFNNENLYKSVLLNLDEKVKARTKISIFQYQMRLRAKKIDKLLPESIRLSEFQKIISASFRIASDEGIYSLLRQAWEKIKKREFRIIDSDDRNI